MNTKTFFNIFFCFIFCSCVGTIEDTSLEVTNTVQIGPDPIDFDGIIDIKAIANDKVEVYFFPADGDSEDLVYIINYDGLSIPITIPGASLKPDYKGLLHYTVIGLEIDTTYNFEVQVKNVKTEARSLSESRLSVTTFSNITANFRGVQSAQPLAGISGINSIKVSWIEAEKQGNDFLPKEIDVTKYIVTIIDSNYLTPGDFHDDTKTEPIRRVIYVSSDRLDVDIGGLQPDTNYFVNVRATHYGDTIFGSDSRYMTEENNEYVVVQTLKPGLSELDFDTTSLSLSLSPGASGLTSVTALWSSAVGVFDHYRVYYTRKDIGPNLTLHSADEVCNGQETSDPAVYCKKVDFDDISTSLVDLDSNKEYDVAIAVCQSVTCSVSTRIFSSVTSIETTPDVASFSGILSIEGVNTFEGYRSIYLNVNPPDLSSGIIDGINVVYYDPVFGEVILNSGSNPSELTIESFNFQTAGYYTIDNIVPIEQQVPPDFEEIREYCFSAHPFTVVEGLQVAHRENEIIRCHLPTIEVPDSDDFEGLSNIITIASSCKLTWQSPLDNSGVYSHFEVYMRDNLDTFSFALAIDEYDSGTFINYSRFFLDVNSINFNSVTGSYDFTVSGLAPGVYNFGVLTYAYMGEDVSNPVKRSSYNNNILSCEVP